MQNEDFKEIKSSTKKNKLKREDIVKIAISTKSIHIKKDIIEQAEKYGLKFYDIYRIAMSTNDLELKEKAIINALRNRRLEGYSIANNVYINKIVAGTNDLEFIKKIISKPETYGIDISDIVVIVYSTNDKELTEDVINNANTYGLDKEWVLEIINKTTNFDLKEKVIANAKKYKLNKRDIVNIVEKTKNIEFTKKIIYNAERYHLNDRDKIQIAMSSKDEELIKKVMTDTKPENYKLIRNKVNDYRSNYGYNSLNMDFIKSNLQLFLKIENATDKENKLLEMYEKNNDILKVKSFDILDEKFLNKLGEEKVNLISCYNNITEKITKLNDKELEFLNNCLNLYLEITKGEEWVEIANAILKNISEYKELIENISDHTEVNMNKVMQIIIHPNTYKIKTIEAVNDFQKLKLKRCEKLINGHIKDKKEAVIQKIFGISLGEAEAEVRKFGNSIEEIEDEELKVYIKSIKEIVELKEPNLLVDLFHNVKSVENVNKILIERMLKNEYGKMYNQGLFDIKTAKKSEEYPNTYEAGTDFKMIMTSVAPYVESQVQPGNYYEDWNRPSLWSQFFCASYIRNDMLGHADVPHVCYGFSEMSDDALIMSGTADIYSENDFVAKSENEEYYCSPDMQINKTIDLNEMDFRRIQNGKRKQPDYIIVFKENGQIKNIENAQKASKEFGGLPIVIIDVNKCLESEKQKVEELYKEYKKSQNPNVREELYQKLRNNRVTNSSFCEEIYGEIYYELQLDEVVNEKDLETIYQQIDATERKEESGKMQKIYKEIKTTLKEEEKGGRE